MRDSPLIYCPIVQVGIVELIHEIGGLMRVIHKIIYWKLIKP